MEALIIYCGDRYGVNAIGIAVKIALVPRHGTIATSKYEYGALSVSTVLNAVEEGLVNDVTWTLHGLAVIWGTPAAGVNVDIMEAIVERRSFVSVRYRAGEDAHACYLRFIGETDTTNIVLRSSDLAGATGAVAVICKDRFGERCMIVKVVGMLGILWGMRRDSSRKQGEDIQNCRQGPCFRSRGRRR